MRVSRPATSTRLVEGVLKGSVRAVAEALTLIENGDSRARPILKQIYPHTGRAHVVGITGTAGTGKSSLIDRMTSEIRRRRRNVGVLLLDPSSPFSGGALLGDRLRLRGHFLDDGVFIRSLAARGAPGGLPSTIRESVHLLDAMGKEIILIETIGVGQDEIEIANFAHTVVLLLTPATGDEVQNLKAGLLEIADVVAIHKADLPGADVTAESVRELCGNPGLVTVKTSIISNEGISDLVTEIEKQGATRPARGEETKMDLDLCRSEVLRLVQKRILDRALEEIRDDAVDKLVRRVARRELDPYTAAEKIASKLW